MKTVTDTNTTARPAPDGPPGLEGGVTYQHRGANYDALKAKAIVPQVLYPIRDVECTNYVSSGQSTPSCQGNEEVEGVSETRCTGAGKVHLTTGETVLYSGLAGDDAPHEKGVALILSKEAGKSLKEWEPI